MMDTTVLMDVASVETLVDLLRMRASKQPDKLAYSFLPDGENADIKLTYQQLEQRAQAIAAWIQANGSTGERVLLLFQPGLDYIAAYFGCLYAGAIAVPAYPPRLNRPTPRIQGIVNDSGATLALTDTKILESLARRFEQLPELAKLRWLDTQTMSIGLESAWRAPQITADSPAFIQYTSGSTSAPKGVIVSHGNLIHNLEAIFRGFQISPNGIGVFWLPSYHDMGLIGGILEPMFVSGPSYLMAPADFLQRPFRWLQAISRYGATISGAPNFAYKLCVEKITPEQRQTLDLSQWQIAFSGAEPINPDTMQEFADTFAPHGFNPAAFYPCYGLAEGTLLASGGNGPSTIHAISIDKTALSQNKVVVTETADVETQTMVSCGQAVHGQTLAIANPETGQRCATDEIGEIWVSGPSVAQGYWGQPEKTAETFQATFPNDNTLHLRTGDLGFLHDGQLYITGRVKDLIIIRGRNLYPQDIEHTAWQSHEALEPGMGAAFSVNVDGEEQLALVYEVKRQHRKAKIEEVATAVRRAIALNHGVQLHSLALIKPLSIPRTSSGKIKRHACKNGLQNGDLNVISQWQRDFGLKIEDLRDNDQQPDHVSHFKQSHITSWLIGNIAAQLNVPISQISIREPFVNYGLDSVQAVALAGDLETYLGRDLSPTLIWDYPNITALADHLANDQSPINQYTSNTVAHQLTSTQSKIAIIGLDCRFPGADSPNAFWELLANGVDAISQVPAERWDIEQLIDENASPENGVATGKMSTRWGGFLNNVDQFDPHFFGISPREAARMDPQQRLLLETSWRALEHAGQAQNLAQSQTAVYVGISSYDYSRIQFGDLNSIDAYAGTGNAHSVAANRLSYLLDLRGPSMAIDTACSSSLVAVHLAMQSLRSGEANMAIAGGVNLLLAPELTVTFSQANMMAKNGRCKTFDAAADGYVRGEGCGVVVLKRLEDAQRDGDNILAVLHGSAVNQDGRSNGLTAPNGPAQQAVIRQALQNASLQPSDISYIEAHGTGTPLGDPIEVQSLRAVLDDERDHPIHLGSVKTNIGHLESAAGIAGLIKTVLALQHQTIPAHLHFNELNPYISLSDSSLQVAAQQQSWAADGARYAGVSSFGFGGTNAHVVLGEAPRMEIRELEIERSAHLLTVSGKSEESLRENTRHLGNFLATSEASLADVCFTLNNGRSHHPYRLALAATDKQSLINQLTNTPIPNTPVNPSTKTAFLFTGQGSQYVGMAQELYETQPTFRADLDRCAEILDGELEQPLLEIIVPVAELVNQKSKIINQTAYTQPA
ncbi:MAG: beta-ketoacyl synthase N-terminal-like domain-containing protein, partial [Chloroflexota bacterium]